MVRFGCWGTVLVGAACIDNTRGKTFIGLFDVDHNCAISVDEVRNNSLVSALFRSDVTLEGQTCMSMGVRAHAVAASFAAPQ